MNILRTWLPLAVVATISTGLVYVSVQQDIRQTANDPQIQLAEDAVTALANGQSTSSVVPTEKTDIKTSLAPYLIVYNESGEPLASSAVLNGQTPVPPAGVLDYALTHEDHRLTWQPQSGVRSAIVVKHFAGSDSGFVLAGRSLREVERREDALLQIYILALALSLLISLATIAIFAHNEHQRQ